jgi:hypothetical protein
MYGATMMDENFKLDPINYAQIQKRYVSPNYDEILGMIHIVHYKSLQEYLNLLRNYYWSTSNRIIQEQNSLLIYIHEVVEYRQRRMHSHRKSCSVNLKGNILINLNFTFHKFQ